MYNLSVVSPAIEKACFHSFVVVCDYDSFLAFGNIHLGYKENLQKKTIRQMRIEMEYTNRKKT